MSLKSLQSNQKIQSMIDEDEENDPYHQDLVKQYENIKSNDEIRNEPNHWKTAAETIGKSFSRASQNITGDKHAMDAWDDYDKNKLEDKKDSVAIKKIMWEQRFKTRELKQELAKNQVFEKQQEETERHNRASEEIDLIKALSPAKEKAPKLSPADITLVREAEKTLKGSGTLIEELDKISKLTDQIEFGGITSEIPGLSSPRMQSYISHGSKGEREEWNKMIQDFVNKSAMSMGSRAGAKIVQYFKEAKPHQGMDNASIKKIVDGAKQILLNEEDEALEIARTVAHPGTPSEALVKNVESRKHRSLNQSDNSESKITPASPTETTLDKNKRIEELERKARGE